MDYPKGILKNKSNFIQYGNRGMNLEADINDTNNIILNVILLTYTKNQQVLQYQM